MQWFGHVLRIEEENVVLKTLQFWVATSRPRRPKQTWKKQVERK